VRVAGAGGEKRGNSGSFGEQDASAENERADGRRTFLCLMRAALDGRRKNRH
jgi:hypothetical protein